MHRQEERNLGKGRKRKTVEDMRARAKDAGMTEKRAGRTNHGVQTGCKREDRNRVHKCRGTGTAGDLAEAP